MNRFTLAAFILNIFLFFSLPGNAQQNIPSESIRFNNENLLIHLPEIIMRNISTSITLKVTDPDIKYLVNGTWQAQINGSIQTLHFENGVCEFQMTFDKKGGFTFEIDDFSWSGYVTPIPLWLSVFPPLIAIIMALVFKEVYSALFFGIFIGTFIIFFYQGQAFFESLFNGFLAVIDTYILHALNDTDHLSIIIFSMMIGGMVGIITKNGGMKGVVNYLSRFAGNARSGQLVTWLMGILIFFDDYANTLVVGNTMRPVTDRLKISRQKLAYIVDSTAAPVASIAFVTTWIGAELSYIQDGIQNLGLPETPYDVFLNSLQYSFYPILTLCFIFFLVWKRRDYGPMYKAEIMARSGKGDVSDKVNKTSELSREIDVDENIKARWYNAVIPVLVVVLGTIAGLIATGLHNVGWDVAISFTGNLSNVIGNSDSFVALLWSSLAGVTIAIVLSVGQRILSLKKSIDALVHGFQTMLTAVLILVLAWAIALITQHLHTAEFISGSLISLQLSPFLIPALTFLLAAIVAFSTGSSWGTMAILYPLMLPASWLICQEFSLDYDTSISIFHNVVSAVLAGSVLGDHCSPISDTTILSSLASSCNHIDHVRTQMPYALTVGVVGLLFGTLPAAYGVPSMVLFPVNLTILFLIIRFVGKKLPIVSIA
nr:Na+/H+ antiporter NhaC family protein [Bacteroidota bacterium]